MTLRERCQAILDQIQRDAILRQHCAADTLVGFVCAEIGRTADKRLKETLPLVLYFPNEQDREEFIAAVHEAKPDMIARRMP
jgi:hypothetical protein